MLFAGDFWQLDPPDGVALSSVPTDLMHLQKCVAASATAAHGQRIFWGRTPWSVQHLTGLTEPYRCQYPWYNEFMEECRGNALSANNHKCTHGEVTDVPGSWLNGLLANDAKWHYPQRTTIASTGTQPPYLAVGSTAMCNAGGRDAGPLWGSGGARNKPAYHGEPAS